MPGRTLSGRAFAAPSCQRPGRFPSRTGVREDPNEPSRMDIASGPQGLKARPGAGLEDFMATHHHTQAVLEAYQALLRRLDQFEADVSSRNVSDVQTLVDACQNFLDAGHNFDDQASRQEGSAPSAPHALSQEQLQHLGQRLREVVDVTIQVQESVRHEAQRLRQGRQGIKGYRTPTPEVRERYLSILG